MQNTVFTVTEVNNSVKQLLEQQFASIWLEAEISNLVQPRSGHIYLTLKDDNAQIRAAMFRGNNQRLTFAPKNGDQVLVRGRLSLFAPRGDFQLIIDKMEEAGLGALQRAFEKLKQKLQLEGLFDEERKKPIPTCPSRIGVVTSPTGAAVHDILSVLKRRFPLTEVVIYPTQVQGEEAAAQIRQAINLANQRKECDVLIVGRGGGSQEDLWCFNDEALARTIVASELPIVSAVGHQVDFTIADFVADVRAPTPSAAAELLSPDGYEFQLQLSAYQDNLANQLRRQIRQKQQRLILVAKHLKHPGRRLEEHAQRLDQLEVRLRKATRTQLLLRKSQLDTLSSRLQGHSPQQQINGIKKDLININGRLNKALQNQQQRKSQQLQNLAQRLNTVSPLNTLARGYSISQLEDGTLLQNSDQVSPGQRFQTRLHQGRVTSIVETIENAKDMEKGN